VLSPTLPNYYVKHGFISGFRESFKSTNHFGVIAQMWLSLFPGSLQIVLESSSNVRSYGTGALHDMALTGTSGV